MPAALPSGVTLTYSQQFRRCGKASCPVCASGGQGHGPYWYAYWREGTRTRSQYLGKQLPPGAMAPPPADQHEQRPTHAAETATVLQVRTLGGFALWRGGAWLAVEGWERDGIAQAAIAPDATARMLHRAVCLFGAAAGVREAIGAPMPPNERLTYEHGVAAVRAALGEAAFAAAWAEGRAMALRDVVAFALAPDASRG